MSILVVVHVMVSAFLIIIILLQQGKGADVGATFGGGGNSLFGAAGADNLLTKVTAFASFGFMATSLLLALGQKPSVATQGDIFKGIPEKAAEVEPATIEVNPEAAQAGSDEVSSSEEADVSEEASVAGETSVSGETNASGEAKKVLVSEEGVTVSTEAATPEIIESEPIKVEPATPAVESGVGSSGESPK